MVAEDQHKDVAAIQPELLPKDELHKLIKEIEKEMKSAAQKLEFEKAAALRDQLFELRGALAQKEFETDLLMG
jgi:excinuclease ABC subunit B